MKRAFTSVRVGLMVGIGGGVPSEEADVRLGDVVISEPRGVVQYDSGTIRSVKTLRAKHTRGEGGLAEHLSWLNRLPYFKRKAAGSDDLFGATYDHKEGATCEQRDASHLVARPRRQEMIVHYGTIASGNQVMPSGAERDRASAELGGVLCFEMEVAGLMNSFPCVVIRGICDYADSQKNKRWQAYAAATAAACAKEVLFLIPPADVAKSRTG